MRKIAFTLLIPFSILSFARSYAPYSFQLVNSTYNPVLDDDFGLIWKFARGYVQDHEEKKENEFFRILIKDIYDSLLFEVKTKHSYAVIPHKYFQDIEHDLIIVELFIDDEKITDIGLTIEKSSIPTGAMSSIDSLNIQLDHGLYLNSIPRILSFGDSVTNEFLTKYKSMNLEWDQIKVPFKWKIQQENEHIKFIEKPTIDNIQKLEKTINKYFKDRPREKQSLCLKLSIEHCFVTNCQSEFPELDKLINTITSDIKLTCTNNEIDETNIHFFLIKNGRKYGAMN